MDGKPYQQHVVQEFYAVDGSSSDAQVNKPFKLNLRYTYYHVSDKTLCRPTSDNSCRCLKYMPLCSILFICLFTILLVLQICLN